MRRQEAQQHQPQKHLGITAFLTISYATSSRPFSKTNGEAGLLRILNHRSRDYTAFCITVPAQKKKPSFLVVFGHFGLKNLIKIACRIEVFAI